MTPATLIKHLLAFSSHKQSCALERSAAATKCTCGYLRLKAKAKRFLKLEPIITTPENIYFLENQVK